MLTLDGGDRVKVDLRSRSLLFGLGSYWSGTMEFRTRNPATPRITVVAPVLTSDQVVTPLAGTCGGVQIVAAAVDTAAFPWKFGTLQLQLDPADGAPTVAASFGATAVPATPSTGRLLIR